MKKKQSLKAELSVTSLKKIKKIHQNLYLEIIYHKIFSQTALEQATPMSYRWLYHMTLCLNKTSHLACRYTGILQSGPGRWPRSDTGTTCTRWCPPRSAPPRTPAGICTETSPWCLCTFLRAHTGWTLLKQTKALIYLPLEKITVNKGCDVITMPLRLDNLGGLLLFGRAGLTFVITTIIPQRKLLAVIMGTFRCTKVPLITGENELVICTLIRTVRKSLKVQNYKCWQVMQSDFFLPNEHSSTSWSQEGPTYPWGQLQKWFPVTGLVSQLEPLWHGLLMQASFSWQSRPGAEIKR